MEKERGLGDYSKRRDHEELNEVFIQESSYCKVDDGKNPIYFGVIEIELLKKKVLKKKGYSDRVTYQGTSRKMIEMVFTELVPEEELKKSIQYKMGLDEKIPFSIIKRDKSKVVGYSLVRY